MVDRLLIGQSSCWPHHGRCSQAIDIKTEMWLKVIRSEQMRRDG